jgi:hypothetical protein
MTDDPNKGGRPLEWTDERIQAEADALLEWMKDDISRLWFKDFAIERGHQPNLYGKLAKRHAGFRSSIKKAKAIQESRTFQGALRGELNTILAIFGLKNNHGWRDTQHTENKTDVKLSTTGSLDVLITGLAEARGDTVPPGDER